MYLQLQLSLSHTHTDTHISSLLLSSTNHGETLRPCGILLCRCCGRSPPHITSSSHFAFTDIPAHSCTMGTFLCISAHLHLIHVHTSPAKMCTLDNILLHNEHIALNFTLEKFFARDPRWIPRTLHIAHCNAQVTQKTWTQLFLNVMLNTLVDHLLGSITMQLVPWRCC